MKIFHDKSISPKQSVSECLGKFGCSREICGIVSELLSETPDGVRECLFLEGKHVTEKFRKWLEECANTFKQEKCSGRQAAIYIAHQLPLFIYDEHREQNQEIKKHLARRLKQIGIDPLSELRAGPPAFLPTTWLASLAQEDDPDITSKVSLEKLESLAERELNFRFPDCNKAPSNEDCLDPDDLRFWIKYGSWRIEDLLKNADRFPQEKSQKLALALFFALKGRIDTFYSQNDRSKSETEKIWNRLDDMLWGDGQFLDGILPRRAWLILAYFSFYRPYFRGQHPLEIEKQERIISAASAELGLFRPLFRQAATPEARKKFSDGPLGADFFKAISLLLCQVDFWAGLKAILLCFRALSAPGVDRELRWWTAPSSEEKADRTWFPVAESFALGIHQFAAFEQDKDSEMTNLRSQFASFCLERIKTRKNRHRSPESKGNEPYEGSEIWREAMIHAAKALHVNPEGKGHHILHWASENDPSESVRQAARDAYPFFRHNPALPNNTSPRRALFHAFWYLRQAHLISLGVEPEQQGAQRTLAEEVRRTAG